MNKRLENKVIIITGAGRGIGHATARLFAREGAKVAAVDIRPEAGEELVRSIRQEGNEALYVNCDVTHDASVKAMVQRVVEEYGTVDVLFNNAGTAIEGKIDVLSEENWDKTFAINVKSMFLTSRHVVPIMKQKKAGVIIHMASESGLVGFPFHPAYCASKGAVLNLTKSMALGHAEDGIRVNCICPGTIPTPLFHELLDPMEGSDQIKEQIRVDHPLGYGTEEDIAYAALFLAGEESRYMTGAPLVVDGGYTAK